jgi:RNA polymerase sigma-70 factor, ECF subfamily
VNISRDSHEQAQQELQTFYQQNLGLIYRYVYSKVGIREEAEDLTAQIFVKAVRDMDMGRDQRSVQKWLFQVAHTTVADYWRHYFRAPVSSLEELLDEGWQGPIQVESSAVSMAPVEKVDRILHLLPKQYRDVLHCRFLLNLSIKETAQKLSLSEANVKVVQFRALKRAAELEPMIDGEG